MNIFEQALKIAKQDLRDCYQDDKLVAGRKHFDDFWARDAFFAIRGVKELGDLKVVKNTLQLFLDFQKDDGQIPRKIARHRTLLKYIFKIRQARKDLKPVYSSSVFYSQGVDQNALLIIAFENYIKKSNDIDFLKENYKKIKKAVFWFFGQDPEKDWLINEGAFSNWMDTVYKSGEVLYSNILYARALKGFAWLSQEIDKTGETRHFEKIYQSVAKKINQVFWNGEYYADWVNKKHKKYNYFDTAGNLLAIYFNIADEEQSLSIFDFIIKQKDSLLKTNYPAYPWWRLSLTRFLSFSPGYQNNYYEWLWISCFYAAALNKKGKKEKSIKILEKISQTIVAGGHVYEVYQEGEPVNKMFFKSEVPFAWSAGLYIYAYNKIINS